MAAMLLYSLENIGRAVDCRFQHILDGIFEAGREWRGSMEYILNGRFTLENLRIL